MKTFISALSIVLLFCQMEFKTEKNTGFSVLKIDTPEVAKEEILCGGATFRAGFKGGDKQYSKFFLWCQEFPPDTKNALLDMITLFFTKNISHYCKYSKNNMSKK